MVETYAFEVANSSFEVANSLSYFSFRNKSKKGLYYSILYLVIAEGTVHHAGWWLPGHETHSISTADSGYSTWGGRSSFAGWTQGRGGCVGVGHSASFPDQTEHTAMRTCGSH